VSISVTIGTGAGTAFSPILVCNSFNFLINSSRFFPPLFTKACNDYSAPSKSKSEISIPSASASFFAISSCSAIALPYSYRIPAEEVC
jgi:hypothetical protein